ncbi:MAG: hypothetical protein C4576_27140 [Desulfobacteraceae bacterium]|nr:MAG: hypothetical protein C4576_27140 [Desulfobacteraceae bacterium]
MNSPDEKETENPFGPEPEAPKTTPGKKDWDVFEGIAFDDLSVVGEDGSKSEKDGIESLEFREINPLQGVDLNDLSVKTDQSSTEKDLLSCIDFSLLSHSQGPAILPELPLERTPAQAKEPEKLPPPVEGAKVQEQNTKQIEPAGPVVNEIVNRGYRYSEINRIREKISMALEEMNEGLTGNGKKSNMVLVISPHDEVGSTFLVSVLGYNAAFFEKKSVLLVDLNLRRPELHLSFGLNQENGFTEIVKNEIEWRNAVKTTSVRRLSVITSGKPDNQLSTHLNRKSLETWIREIQRTFDLVVFDSSPVLTKNRNNVDPVFLSRLSDWVVMILKEEKTTRADLKNAVSVITKGGGKINGIVSNQQLKKDVLAKGLRRIVDRSFAKS